MTVEQCYYAPDDGWIALGRPVLGASAQLAFVFGGRHELASTPFFDQLRVRYPEATILLASTAGEILGTEVTEHRATLTALRFDATAIESTCVNIDDVESSYDAGCLLAERLACPDLVHVFVVSDGQRVNGSELAEGFNTTLPAHTLLTGGLAGDGRRFERTLVGLNGPPREGMIAAIGFYGDRLRVGYGSSGGWAPFGPLRRVTHAQANCLYELDGRPALELYRKYLGEFASELPSAAMRFPLCITDPDTGRMLVRTILSIDEDNQCMVFAGDMPVGTKVRFMRASYEDLVDGAAGAAEHSVLSSGVEHADLAICVSCVGRKIVLGQRTEEETEIVRETIGQRPAIMGFYSYGELAPPESAPWCELHNQTMTITLMKEL